MLALDYTFRSNIDCVKYDSKNNDEIYNSDESTELAE